MIRKGLWQDIKCRLFGHDPEGPDMNVSFKHPDGHYVPMYYCRKCGREMMLMSCEMGDSDVWNIGI